MSTKEKQAHIEKLESPPGKTRWRVRTKRYYNAAICNEIACTSTACDDCTSVVDEWFVFPHPPVISSGTGNRTRIVGKPTGATDEEWKRHVNSQKR